MYKQQRRIASTVELKSCKYGVSRCMIASERSYTKSSSKADDAARPQALMVDRAGPGPLFTEQRSALI